MARIKIKFVPKKLGRYAIGGEQCPEGYAQDQFGNCVPDFSYQPAQQGFGTGMYQPTNVANQYAISQPMTISMGNPPPGFNNNALKGNNNLVSNAPAGYSKNYSTIGLTPTIDQSGLTGGFDWNQGTTDIMGNSTVPKAPINPNAPKLALNKTTTPKPGLFECPKGYIKDASGTCVPKENKNTFGNAMNNIGNTLSGLGPAFGKMAMGLNYLDNMKKQKAYDAWQGRMKNPESYTALDTSKDRGDYDQQGIFRPDQMGFKSKGMQANAYYPQQNNIAAFGMEIASNMQPRYVGDVFTPSTYTAVPYIPREPMAVAPVSASAPTSASVPESSFTSETFSSADSNAEYVLPVQNFKLTSGFGNRKSPIKGASTNHNGLDLAVPVNTNVFTPMDGVIKSVYSNGNGGNQLLIQHSDGSVSGYAHLNKFNVKVGDKVSKGQVIALSGNTGNSSGPHLHFTWHDPSGKTVDPRTRFNFDLNKKSPQGKGSSEQFGNQVSLTHNNPMNVHYGDFASKYGATPGANDSGGKVAKFADLETGIRANRDLMFGPGYINLTISQARNRWVSGNPNVSNSSTTHIVKAMGGDRKLADLTPAEKDKLFKEFARWEGSQGYNLIKNKKIFDEGGQTNDTNMKIRIIGTPENKNMKIRIAGVPGKKVRIVGTPDEQQEMKDGGQSTRTNKYTSQSSGYGLNLGHRTVYADQPDNPYSSASKTLQPVPRDQANIEAEKGETVYGDIDGDGQNEHMNIAGKRHVDGGTPLNVPEGAFIYSDTNKMRIKDPEVLKFFGITSVPKVGITPATIAKKYDINKFKAILQDPNTDKLAKDTAEKMIQNYEQKLGYLALIQESMKGFPQGIPAVAEKVMGAMQQEEGGEGQASPQEMQEQAPQEQGPEEEMMEGPQGQEAPQEEQMEQMPPMQRWGGSAGLRKFVGGGPADPNDPFGLKAVVTANPSATSSAAPSGFNLPSWYKPWTTPNTPAGARSPKGPSSTYNYVQGNPVYDDYQYWRGQSGRDFNNAADYQKYVFDEIQKDNPDAYKYMENTWGPTAAGRWDDGIMGARTMYAASQRKKPPVPKSKLTITSPTPEDYPETPPIETPPGVPPFQAPPGIRNPKGWTQQNINSLGNAYMSGALIDKYHGYRQSAQPVLPTFIPKDWRGYAGTLTGQQNADMQMLANFRGGQGLGANASALQGQRAGDLAKYISGVDEYNAQGATAMDAQRADILNKFNMYNKENVAKSIEDENTLDSKYKAALTASLKGITAAKNQGITDAGKMYNFNLTNPYYKVDPRTQMMRFDPRGGYAAFMAQTQGGGNQAPQDGGAAYAKTFKDVYDQLGYITDPKERQNAAEKYAYAVHFGNKTSNTTYPTNSAKNRQVVTGYGPADADA